jgi:hypothetical protein
MAHNMANDTIENQSLWQVVVANAALPSTPVPVAPAAASSDFETKEYGTG